MARYVAIDLDGTLAQDYGGRFEYGVIGAAVPEMVNLVQRFLNDGVEVRIMTARVYHPAAKVLQTRLVQEWLMANGMPPLEVQAHKCSDMICLFDDRAVQVQRNTGRILGDVQAVW